MEQPCSEVIRPGELQQMGHAQQQDCTMRASAELLVEIPYRPCSRSSSGSTSSAISDAASRLSEVVTMQDGSGDPSPAANQAYDEEKAVDTPRTSLSSISPTTPDIDIVLPPKAGSRVYRWLRWNFFSTYRIIFTFVFLANFAVLTFFVSKNFCSGQGLSYSCTLTATSVNLLVSIIARHEHFVNLLFQTSTAVSPRAPLWLRKLVAKIYAYGGLHSGCAVAAVFWYGAFTALVLYHTLRPPYATPAVVTVTCAVLLLLLLITIFAHPALRRQLHDWFEMVHRFAGWTVVALFWTQTMLMASLHASEKTGRDATLGHELLITPAFWCILVITLCIIYPWARLSRHEVVAERLSSHAIRLHFSYRDVTYCQSIRLATNPLTATHAFATIAGTPASSTESIDRTSQVVSPTTTTSANSQTELSRTTTTSSTTKSKGFSVVVSKAGDWTSSIIANPPRHLYVRGGPTYGVLRVAVLFSPVLIVATGSGIGPCLSLFRGKPDLNYRILWSTQAPLETYGKEILQEVMKADPEARIIDTKKSGRPDLVALSWAIWKRRSCEAVVLISNPAVTKQVIYGLETRGVPAFAPIFDS